MKQRTRTRPALRAVAAALAVVAALALAGVAGAAQAPKSNGSGANALAALQRQFIDIVARVRPSVVLIRSQDGLGSGIVWDRQGRIVTNAHVVGSSQKFTVALANGKNYPAKLVGTYPINDLAVIDIDASGLRPAAFASNTLRVGSIVFAVGNPLGLRSSVTQGIVSALGRTLSEPNGAAIANLIQTSADINPGNSGGALVDIQGRVVGIPTLGTNAGNGIGFAIPAAVVKRIVPQLIQSGRVTSTGRAYLGVQLGDVQGGGAYVGGVKSGGPAAKAGLRSGDVIVSIAGRAVDSAQTLAEVLANLSPGQRVPVVVQRESGRTTLEVTLGEYPAALAGG